MNEPISGEKAAFPWPKNQNENLFSIGVNLRDYFAAAALQGMNLDGEFAYETYALDAYKMADAMIRARGSK